MQRAQAMVAPVPSYVARKERQERAARLVLPTAAITGLLWITSANSVSPVQGACAFLLLLFPWWAYSSWKRTGTAQLPIFAILSAVFWVYFAIPLFWGNRIAPGSLQGTLSDSAITQAMIMAVVGVGALWLGIRTPLPHRLQLKRVRDIPLEPKRWAYLRFLLVVGAVLTLIPNAPYLLGPAGRQLIVALTGTIPLIVFIFLFRGFLRGTSTALDRYALVLYVGSQLVVGLASGWLGSWVGVMIAGGASYLAERRKIPIVPVLIVAAYVLFFQAGKNDYRTIYWYGTGQQTGTLSRVEAWAQLSLDKWGQVLGSGGQQFGPQILGNTVQRLSLLSQTAYVVEVTPTYVPYQYGSTYSSVVVNLIPRAVWPDKPTINVANQFYQVAYGLTAAQNLSSVSISSGVLAEGYINFGWPGVVAVMFLLGILFGCYRELFLSSRSGLFYSAVGITLMVHFVTIEAQLAQYLGGVLQAIVVALVVFVPASRWVQVRDEEQTMQAVSVSR